MQQFVPTQPRGERVVPAPFDLSPHPCLQIKGTTGQRMLGIVAQQGIERVLVHCVLNVSTTLLPSNLSLRGPTPREKAGGLVATAG